MILMTDDNLVLAIIDLHAKALVCIKSLYKERYLTPKFATDCSIQVLAYCRDRGWLCQDSSSLTKTGVIVAETLIME